MMPSGTFKDFHTSVYLKIEGYRGIPFPVITELTWTGLLMAAVLVALAVGLPTIAHFLRGGHALVAAAALCHLGMALQYTVLAATINRLRGIWGPSLCVLAGLLPSEVLPCYALHWPPIFRRQLPTKGADKERRCANALVMPTPIPLLIPISYLTDHCGL